MGAGEEEPAGGRGAGEGEGNGAGVMSPAPAITVRGRSRGISGDGVAGAAAVGVETAAAAAAMAEMEVGEAKELNEAVMSTELRLSTRERYACIGGGVAGAGADCAEVRADEELCFCRPAEEEAEDDEAEGGERRIMEVEREGGSA